MRRSCCCAVCLNMSRAISTAASFSCCENLRTGMSGRDLRKLMDFGALNWYDPRDGRWFSLPSKAGVRSVWARNPWWLEKRQSERRSAWDAEAGVNMDLDFRSLRYDEGAEPILSSGVQ